jgi:hypothetical protein
MKQQKTEMDEIIEIIAQAMAQKKDLLSRCQRAVDEVRQREEDLAIEVRRIHKQGDEAIEQDRLTFRSTYDKRLSSKLEQRLQEHKDATARALEPEIQRLKALHDREIHEIENEFSKKQQLLLDEIEVVLSRRIAAAKAELEKDLDEKLSQLEREALQKKHRLQDEHLETTQSLRDDLDRQLSTERSRLQRRFEVMRRDAQDELARMQQESRRRVDEIRSQHRDELTAIEKSFENQVTCDLS